MAVPTDNQIIYDCTRCRAQFQTYKELEDHKANRMKEGNGHIHCKVCGSFFRIQYSLTEHIKEYHPHKQDIKCPGCEKPFTRITSLVDHIEKNKCPKINAEEVQKARLGKALVERRLDTKTNFSDYIIPFEELAKVDKIPHHHDGRGFSPSDGGEVTKTVISKDALTDLVIDSPAAPENMPSKMNREAKDESLLPKLEAEKSLTLSLKESRVTHIQIPKSLPPHLRIDVRGDYWLNRKAEEDSKQNDSDENTEIDLGSDNEDLSDDDDNFAAIISQVKALVASTSSLFSSPAGSVIGSNGSMIEDLAAVNEAKECVGISNNGREQTTVLLNNVDSNLEVGASDPWGEWSSNQEDLFARCNPDSPSFDPKFLYMEHTREYLCSKCSDRFPSVSLLVLHLRDPTAHRPKQKAVCPQCSRVFKSIPALMAHCESESRRCRLRNTESYRAFLNQLTGGIADLGGTFTDKTNRYVVTRDAIEKYGSKKPREDVIHRDLLAFESRSKQKRRCAGKRFW